MTPTVHPDGSGSHAALMSVLELRPEVVGIVVLNYRNAAATIRCLESLENLEGSPASWVVVVDNDSRDGSFEEIARWLGSRWRGRVVAGEAAFTVGPDPSHPVAVLIPSASNSGYSGGNNAGIRWCLARGVDAVLILNNDAQVQPGALAALLRALHAADRPAVVGATILDLAPSSAVQCYGGARYNWWLSCARPVLRPGRPGDPGQVDYVWGACMLIPADVFRDVGLLDEDFFLYGEDVEYCWRCRRAGRGLAVATDAMVRHGFGETIGSSRSSKKRSALSVFHSSRSALLLARKHRRTTIPTVLAARTGQAFYFLALARRQLFVAAIRGIISGLVTPLGCSARH